MSTTGGRWCRAGVGWRGLCMSCLPAQSHAAHVIHIGVFDQSRASGICWPTTVRRKVQQLPRWLSLTKYCYQMLLTWPHLTKFGLAFGCFWAQ